MLEIVVSLVGVQFRIQYRPVAVRSGTDNPIGKSHPANSTHDFDIAIKELFLPSKNRDGYDSIAGSHYDYLDQKRSCWLRAGRQAQICEAIVDSFRCSENAMIKWNLCSDQGRRDASERFRAEPVGKQEDPVVTFLVNAGECVTDSERGPGEITIAGVGGRFRVACRNNFPSVVDVEDTVVSARLGTLQ